MINSPDPDRARWIGLDIGGANIKAAHGCGQARNIPFEVWKRPDELSRAIADAVAMFPPYDCAAVTMTAELCDCYPTKIVGVGAILDVVVGSLLGRPIVVWGIDGEFHRVAAVRRRPTLAAAANWLALATLAARLIPAAGGILIDVGTTTTDLIPLDGGRVVANGQTDTERLQTGELIYAGIRRTPICALATELPVRGVPTGLAAEIFASTLDVYLTLGDTEPNPRDLSTADGRPATVEAARDRLARMVGADRDCFSDDDAREFSQAADLALMNRLVQGAQRVCRPVNGRPAAAVIAGAGEFLARRLAARVIEPGGPIVSLREAWGPLASSAGCAYALVELASERFPCGLQPGESLDPGRRVDGNPR
jgi:probable H4MPT-linked C1 transfer pathway protein